MDKKKKIISIGVFVVFLVVIGIYAKNAFFTEEIVEEEFNIVTPDVEEAKLDSISKMDGYDNESYRKAKRAEYNRELLGSEINSSNGDSHTNEGYTFNPFRNTENSEAAFSNEEQARAEAELMSLLNAQAEINAKAQDNLIKESKGSGQQQDSYTGINTIEEEEEEEEPLPPNLTEQWGLVKEKQKRLIGINGMSDIPVGLDLIPAESVDKRVLKLGSTIAIRLKKAIYLEEQNLHIPKDAILYGKTSFGGLDRMKIEIISYKTNEKVYPVSLAIYDFDGRPGIHLGNNSWSRVPPKVAKAVFQYVQQKGTAANAFGGDNRINPDEVKTVATVATINEIIEEFINKKRVLMPQKYHVWINIVDKTLQK